MQGRRWLIWAGILLPPALVCWKLVIHGFAFPYGDEIRLALFLEKLFRDDLSLLDLWVQHDAHRPFFPRLLLLGIAAATDWQPGWVLTGNLLLAVATYLLLALLLFRRTPLTAHLRPWWALPLLAFLVFSWAQFGNWIWGRQLMLFLCNLSVVTAIVLLTGQRLAGLRFLLAILFAVVATYSNAQGLLFWIAALPVVIWGGTRRWEQRTLRGIVWLGAGAVCVQSYFLMYIPPEDSRPLAALLEAPAGWLGQALLFIGSPVAAIFSSPAWEGSAAQPLQVLHFLPGIAGLLLFLLLIAACLTGSRRHWQILTPWASLGCHALLCALAAPLTMPEATLARGLESANISTAMLFWCALLGMIAYTLYRWQLPDPASFTREPEWETPEEAAASSFDTEDPGARPAPWSMHRRERDEVQVLDEEEAIFGAHPGDPAIAAPRDTPEEWESIFGRIPEESRDALEAGTQHAGFHDVGSPSSEEEWEREEDEETKATYSTAAVLCALVAMVCTVLAAYQVQAWEEDARAKRLAWEAIVAGDVAPLYLELIHADPALMHQVYLPFLRQHELAGFHRAGERDPARAPVFRRQAQRFHARGMPRHALRFVETALLFDPGDPAARALHAEVLRALQGRPSSE